MISLDYNVFRTLIWENIRIIIKSCILITTLYLSNRDIFVSALEHTFPQQFHPKKKNEIPQQTVPA